MPASVLCRSSLDVSAPLVRVEVHIAGGLPRVSIVGLAETAVKESMERVRAAIQNSRYDFPSDRRITVNLAPADMPKEGGRYDLPIAAGILIASGQIRAAGIGALELAGELSLNGALRPIRGALPMALAASRSGRGVVLPEASAVEAALVRDSCVYAAGNLEAVCDHLSGKCLLAPCARPSLPCRDRDSPDLADVQGQAQARRSLEIAAAGGHSLLMIGPPGTGKTMLAERLPGLLPPLSESEAIESAAVASLKGEPDVVGRWRRRPFRAPHHTASAWSLAGGGRFPRPGELSLAHNGVLFLDELPEFDRRALEVLRQPLESGRVAISRVAAQIEFPARVQLVAAMNPCPCGYSGDPERDCNCSDTRVASYRHKISGPLLDRIDLHIHVPRQRINVLAECAPSESSARVRERVLAARERQVARGALNALLPAEELSRFVSADDAARRLLKEAAETLHLSARAQHKVLRIARSVADLAGEARVREAHLAEAVGLRCLDVGSAV